MRLSDQDILAEIQAKRIGIQPMPNEEAIAGLTVDLRLADRFQAFSNNSVPYLDLSGDRVQLQHDISQVMSKDIHIQHQDSLFIHPGELVLGSTLESLSIPDNLVGWLDGRSSLARLGLMVHVTAGRIDPGWEGQVVLELYNNGKLPLALKPGMVICALSFEQLTSSARKPYSQRQNAKYRNQRGPISSRIADEQTID